MRVIRTVAELRSALASSRREGRTIGLVPTMGAFHEGHLSLMRRARADCELVVVSLFINPAQFSDPSDLDGYPRDESRDAAMAAAEGVDLLFAPAPDEVYPKGFSTTVSVAGLTERLEGAHRGKAHFDGVTTIVAKLLNMVMPHTAYFGQKDAQQVIVIKRLVRDLDLPVRIDVCPTVREADGLALSSRNVHLSREERARAAALNGALDTIEAEIHAGASDTARITEAGRRQLAAAGIEPEYLELVSPDTLAPVGLVERPVLALVAARVGATRLIDNHVIQPLCTAAPEHHARQGPAALLSAVGSANDGRP